MGTKRLRLSTPPPVSTAVIYTAVGCLWILLSSDLVSSQVGSPRLQAQMEMAKGVLYVVASGVLIYFLLREKTKTVGPGTLPAQPVGGVGLVVTILLLIFLVPFIGYSVIAVSTPEVEKRAMAHVHTVAENNYNNIRLWVRERIQDVDSVRRSAGFADALETLIEQRGGVDEARQSLADRLGVMLDAYGYTAIWLLDEAGGTLARFGESGNPLPPDIDNRLAALAGTDRPAIDISLLRDKSVTVSMEVTAPVRRDGRLLGFLLFAINGSEQVFDIMRDMSVNYATHETLLVHLDGPVGDVLHVKQIESGEPELIELGLEGSGILREIQRRNRDSGILSGKDHHGNTVLAAYRRLDGQPWYLLVKVDREEALAAVRQQASWVTLLSFLTVTAIGGMLMLLWRQQRKNSELSLLAASAEHERAMREREEVYRELFEANPHPMWVYERQTLRFLAVNEAAIRQYGYSHDEFMAMTIRDIQPPESVDRLQDHLATVKGRGTGITGRWTHHRKDGSVIRVEVSAHQLDFNGREAELVLAYDLTDQIVSEERLIESEQFTKGTLDSLEQQIVVLDENGALVANNQSWRDFALANDGDLAAVDVGANYIEVCRRASAEVPEAAAMLEALEDILAGKRDYFHQEYPCHSPTENRWFVAHVVKFRGSRTLRVVVSHENISQRKEAELELLKLNRYYAAISEINNIIIRAGDVDTMLYDVCRVICTQAELQIVTVSRIDDGYIDMNCQVYGGPPQFKQVLEQTGRLELGNRDAPELSARAALENRTLVSNDYLNNDLREDWYEDMHGWGVRAVAICPIKCRNGLWGLLNFSASEKDYFTPDLIALLEELAADVALGIDMIELQKASQEAEKKLLLNASIIGATHEGLFIVDDDNRITMINPAMTDITGYSEDELLGTDWIKLGSGQQTDAFYRRLRQQLDTTNRWEGEIWDRRKNGEVFPAWLSITRVHDVGEGSHHSIAIYRDVTERKEYERRIEHLANHDVLTGLPNRFLLNDRATLAMAQASRHCQKMAVLFIDLDNFKLVNDTLGHEIGDELLRETGRRIVGSLRESDTVSRIGGDEFLALATELRSSADAALVAEKIIDTISRPLLILDENLIVTASVGVALFPDNAGDLETLTRLADAAMLNAKQSGNNRFRLYSGEMVEGRGKQLKMLNELRQAITRDQIYLVYQPQFNMNTNAVAGLEALVRWEHPDYGPVTPEHFIPIAERSGLIVELGDWILTQACRQARSWHRQGLLGFPVAVNVSALQFRQPDFVEKVEAALRESGLSAEFLELEIVETMLMIDLDDALKKLKQLDKLGVKIAIDDFGTGYSSLSYLLQLSAHVIKIDRSFVRDIPHSQDASAIAKAILSMGNSLGMEIIAEGVETQAQADYLSGIGCKYGQGYYYARPMKAADIEGMLEDVARRRLKRI